MPGVAGAVGSVEDSEQPKETVAEMIARVMRIIFVAPNAKLMRRVSGSFGRLVSARAKGH